MLIAHRQFFKSLTFLSSIIFTNMMNKVYMMKFPYIHDERFTQFSVVDNKRYNMHVFKKSMSRLDSNKTLAVIVIRVMHANLQCNTQHYICNIASAM